MEARKSDRHTIAPFPLRMPEDVRMAALAAKDREERSLNWVLIDRLRKAFKIAKK